MEAEQKQMKRIPNANWFLVLSFSQGSLKMGRTVVLYVSRFGGAAADSELI